MKGIKITNDTGVGYRTVISDAETGEKIPGVYRIEITIDVNEPVTCTLYARQVAVDLLVHEYVKHVEVVHPAPGAV